ncbi:MAG TPA: hypothetical protein VGM82_22215 [Gemmatimonadaceae bacterium]|jgi:hypothetical protein
MSVSESDIRTLNDLRHALLALHKTLLDRQRLWYEREHGRLEGGGQMLQLLAYDPAFAWLRVLSALIVQIDERLDDKEQPLTSEGANILLDEARGVIVGNAGGDEYQDSYSRALQESPDAVIAQSKVARLLGR